MLTPGQFDVSATGAAAYTIPIAVPPGTAGMVPSLSLDYSSQNGDGIMGLGWELSGLPSIGRCPRTIAQDGVHGSVNYDANDKFCLEGQRLVAISGTYGANGTEYRTEIDGFSKIVSYGTAGTGPAYFKVWTKSGQIMEFGNTADSRFLAVGTTSARAWGVNKISDVKGNYLNVFYYVDATNGEARPDHIEYTGNAGASLSPYNSVWFEYTVRPDIVTLYQAGSKLRRSWLLTEVATYTTATKTASAKVSNYKITYLSGASTIRRSKVASIQLCDGAATPNCLPATTFTWNAANDPINYTTTSWPQSPMPPMPFQMGDFNGDGRTDIVQFITQSSITYWLGTNDAGTNQFTSQSKSISFYTDPYFQLLWIGLLPFDLTADGFTEGLVDYTANFCNPYDYPLQCYYVGAFGGYSVKNDKSGNQQWWGGPPGLTAASLPHAPLGDFDGDGAGDALWLAASPSTAAPVISNRDGTFSAGASLSGLYTNSVAYSGDFDGDGCSDVLAQGAVNQIYYLCPSVTTSTQGVSNWSGTGGGGYTLVLGDFNGDGKTDVLAAHPTATGGLYLATGKGFASSVFTVPAGWAKYQIFPGDFNGDGQTDLALMAANSAGGNYGPPTQHSIQLSTGSGFVQSQTIANPSEVSTVSAGDFNSDGAADLWIKKASSNIEYLTTFNPELIKSIDNGLGIVTTITYDRLNKAAVYTKETNASYPTVDLSMPGYVVAEVDTSNGLTSACVASTNANCFTIEYDYVGAKAHQQGRGFLGFHKRIAKRLQPGLTDIVQTTTFL